MRRTTLETAVPAIILILVMIAPVFAMRDPVPGGMQLYNHGGGAPVPAAQYSDGMNLYQYVRSQPVTRTDPSGLWGGDVHNKGCKLGNTVDWATGVGYPQAAANAVGVADEAVDGWGGYLPIWGDQSYHFNRNFGVGADSRLQRFAEHLIKAKDACNWVRLHNDDPDEAAKQLGTALHPLQDWVAHGDYGRTDDVYNGGTWIVHNSPSPQTSLFAEGKTDVSNYPDDPELDALYGPDGRPAGPAILYTLAWHGFSGDREYAIYVHGRQRINLTKEQSETALTGFRAFVMQAGGCKCRKYFGID